LARRIALILTSILCVYLLFAALRGIDLLRVDDPAVQGLGIAVLILPIIGIILVIREIRFGKLSYTMGQLVTEALLPKNGLSEEEKQHYLDQIIEKTKTDLENWQYWYCVALGYDLTNERKLARESMQHSVELYQAAKPK
jgi:hypothetical protein